MGIGIKFKLNWDCITLPYIENNTVALRIFEEYYCVIEYDVIANRDNQYCPRLRLGQYW